MRPVPRQCGQVCCSVKKPCETRTWPLPPQVSQVTGLLPLAAPLPWQSSHSTNLLTSISTRACRTPPRTDRARPRSADRRRETPAGRHRRDGAAEDVAEHIAEDIAEGLGAVKAAARAADALRLASMPGVPVLIVDRALLRVREHLVGFLGLLELLLGLVIARIAIGVELHRQAAIGLLDLGLGRVASQVEYLVVIAFGHDVLSIPCTLTHRLVHRATALNASAASTRHGWSCNLRAGRIRQSRCAAAGAASSSGGATALVANFLELRIDHILLRLALRPRRPRRAARARGTAARRPPGRRRAAPA